MRTLCLGAKESGAASSPWAQGQGCVLASIGFACTRLRVPIHAHAGPRTSLCPPSAVPREFFSLPEFPAPPELELPEYPSGESLNRYIEAYAQHFGLDKLCLFGARVSERCLDQISG